ncbi:MAG TPA: hypothetical protein VFD84_07790, partial [Candidatus Binatia bacterium]|nr:hypothetical protein [Candidatus Binatia bacterium]
VRPRCRVVTCGANAALAPAVEEALAAAGIVVIPDFLASAGGILVSHFWPLDPPPQAAVRLIERRFRGIVAALFTAAARAGDPPAARARMLATANLERLERAGAGGLRHERVLSRLGAARVRRLLPARVRTGLVTWLARALHPAVARA